MKYLSFYNTTDEEGRNTCLAATNKMDYICKSLVANGETVEIISASIASKKGHFKGRTETISDGITLKLFSAYKWGNIFQKLWTTLYSFFTVFFYLLFKVKRKETILVYHSLGYLKALRLAKFFKGFKIILEVEEIYGDVSNCKKTVKKELKFFKKADGYIFPTELLNEKINTENKPYAIIHGTYNVENPIGQKRNDGRIHCVYAGTFDPRKGGVAAAVAAGAFLDERYHIHILGFGSEEQKKLLMNQIEEANLRSKCKVTYDGLLSGEEYIKFLQSCDIGLSTQNPNAAFNDTSFPSKVLSYMANGLRVVSIRIKALECSAVNELLYYYNENTPEEIANAIKAVDMSDGHNSREKIKELDKKFEEDLKKLLGNCL